LGSLNVLVNNAGIVIPGSVESLDEADWDRTIDVDLKSVFLGCKAALPLMASGAPGSIVNISSISALIAGHNFAAYNAAKAGVHLLTKSVALHAARKGYGVRCNSIHPAFIDTGMIDEVVRADTPEQAREKLARQVPLGIIGTVEDVGWAVVYLASDESRFITGAELKLDGGLSAM
jgi:NAD(P)-dependent dehydrogenase (short-subunit alcohol dehydrogenase family)